MKDEEIIAGNKLIAEFMGCYGASHFCANEEVYRYGFKDTHITERWHESEFSERTPYNSSWDWLMPVVTKICLTRIGNGVRFIDYPYLRTFGMIHDDGGTMVRFNGHQVFVADSLIEATYSAVIDFINQNKTSCPEEKHL